MERSLVIEALGHAARKRHILDPTQSARLNEVLATRGLHTLEKLRAWLSASDGISVSLAKELLKHLAKADQPPFGLYRPLAHLANGGMGSAWLASAPDSSELVLVKTMRKDLAQNPEFAKRFERETKLMMELRHPGIVHCQDSGRSADGTLFMVLEFMPTGDLKDLAEGRGIPEIAALSILHQVVGGLGEAHRRKLVHRDIKPANIFASLEGKAKLADFGIARSTAEHRTMLTMAGAQMGSPPYMSPEQVLADDKLDIRSDIYAIGAVLFFTLTGEDCYQGQLQEVLHQHCTAPIPEVRRLKPKISEATAKIIATCMAKKPESRYQDPTALLAAIAAALRGLGQDPAASGGVAIAPPPPKAAPDAADNLTETMLSRLLTADKNAMNDSSLSIREPTPMPASNVATMIAGAGSAATRIMDDSSATVAEERIDGDLATALASPWLTIGAGETMIMLFAKGRLALGKLREPPIDICLRNYPTANFRDDCQRVSRHHLNLYYDPVGAAVMVEDAGSGNGSAFDGAPLPPNQPKMLETGRDHALKVAGGIELRLRCHARQGVRRLALAGAPPSGGAFPCGLDVDHLFDAVTLTRPTNRPGLAFALVLRRVTIGGPGTDLPVPGATLPYEISLFNGRWIWRVANNAWKPLTPNTPLPCAGQPLIARPGMYEDFQ